MVISKLVKKAENGINGMAIDLKCDLEYFKDKISYIELIAAEVYKLKQREQYLSEKERKALLRMEEDLDLQLRSLEEKCGVRVSKEQVFRAVENNKELLQHVSEVLTQFSLPAREQTEQNK